MESQTFMIRSFATRKGSIIIAENEFDNQKVKRLVKAQKESKKKNNTTIVTTRSFREEKRNLPVNSV